MYEALIRRFQSRAEKDVEAQAKGYSRTLEGDLRRGEAKLAALAAKSAGEPSGVNAEPHVDAWMHQQALNGDPALPVPKVGTREDVTPLTKERARGLWDEFLTERFVRGEDPDFDYSTVDNDDELDVLERQDAQDAWFDDEEPSWVNSGGDKVDAHTRADTVLEGETGIQDF
ncbi:hypothetical protein jhhlp_000566 [Lomentospora prolificans]|uniref:CCD97-like C-terminal domain-containing protein n=1 Tax=Lomentospora prolificans TaxID=41688 RepID=A0A2N3NLA4_9PEZI|nr:hypothetical protein jhhlp_000566 [Lomentospora prolificans]